MKILSVLAVILVISSCSQPQTTQVADGTFVHNQKVYKIVDNELTLIGDLTSDSIREFQVTEPEKREFGEDDINFVKDGASVNLDALYRGTTLYYNFNLSGFNDLKENYNSGHFILQFFDEHGFILHSTVIATEDLTGMVGADQATVEGYSSHGKTEMSIDIYKAISDYSVSSTVKPKTARSIWGW